MPKTKPKRSALRFDLKVREQDARFHFFVLFFGHEPQNPLEIFRRRVMGRWKTYPDDEGFTGGVSPGTVVVPSAQVT
jgi:hypothetical protein